MGFTKYQKDTFIDIEGRKKTWLFYVYNLLCILSFGILYIISTYSPKIKILLTTKKCSLRDATLAVITNKFGKIEILHILLYNCEKSDRMARFIFEGKVRVLDTEYARLIYDFVYDKFVIYRFDKLNLNFTEIYENKIKINLHKEEIEIREKEILYGKNINNLRLHSITEILLINTFNITNLIDVFCVVLWFNIEYKIYGSIVALFRVYSNIQDNYRDISKKIDMESAQKQTEIKTLRNGKFRYKNSIDLLPGDLVYIEPCKDLPADIKLLKGDVISDESFLTGESIPICKSSSQDSNLYSGTAILRSLGNYKNVPKTKFESLYRIRNLIKKDSEKLKEPLKNKNITSEEFENYAIGMVIGTGFNTVRGRIFKDIINPKPVKIPFLVEARIYIFYTIILAFCFTLLLSIYFQFILHWTLIENLIYTADLFFTLASPALYASLNVGMQISNQKLQEEKIKCNNTDRILLSGNIDMAIFDKTGTLTSEGLDFLYFDNLKTKTSDPLDVDHISRMGLSSCHSVYELDGKYCGDSLDIQMFIMSKSQIVMDTSHETNESYRKIIMGQSEDIKGPFLKGFNTDHDNFFYQTTSENTINLNINCEKTTNLNINCENTIKICRTFDFTSETKRMSVFVENAGKKYIFTKGSPETIQKLLSNVPDDFENRVKEHSLSGFRVISLAYKELNNFGTQKECEKNLIFLGHIVFSNKVKPETFGVIQELNFANINSIICTGDNILTAISVARECKIIEEAITVIFPVLDEKSKNIYDVEWVCLGDEDLVFDKIRLLVYKNTFDTYCNDFVVACEGKEYEFFLKTQYKTFILEKGKIFARFSPAQKKSLVEEYRNLNNNVLFCGDGANDSGAIGTADVGIALAKNEAGLAASFRAININAVPILIKECRNAYVSSISLFKYVSMSYFLAFVSLAFPVLRCLFLSDFQTLHIDIFIIVPMMFLISNFKRSTKLHNVPPNISLFDAQEFLPFFISLILQTLIIFVFSNYGPSTDEIAEHSKAGTMIFFVLIFQVIFNGIYLSDALPHRESIWENRNIIVFSLLFVLINFILLFLNYFCFPFTSKYLFKYRFVEIEYNELLYILFGIFLSGLACLIAPFYARKFCSKKK